MTDLILYTSEDGRVQLRADGQTVWLSQREMAELFDVSTDNVGVHLKNLYEDGELSREATTEESSVVQIEGTREVQRTLTLYNLDAILAVGYRVRSPRGVQFRRWVFICPEGASAYQPMVQPWVLGSPDFRVLKERSISSGGGRAPDQPLCGVPSERMNGIPSIPRVAPWAGMRRPVGAVAIGPLN